MASFRQRGRYLNNRSKQGGRRPRFGGSLFGSRFQPSEEYQDQILIIPANYLTPLVNDEMEIEQIPTEYFFYRQHYDSRRHKYIHCSGGPYYKNKDMTQPCLGCFVNRELTEWEDDKKVKDSHVSYARAMRAFTILHFHRYHYVEQIKDGEYVMNPKTNKPYMNWVRCEGPGNGGKCPMCGDDTIKTTEVRKLHWSLGPTHYNSIEKHNDRICSNCTNCGTKGSINWEAWVCPHCACPHIERDTTALKQKDIDDLVSKPIVCPNCNVKDFPNEEYFCEECGKAGVRMTIFDTQLLVDKEVQESNDGTMTVIHVETAEDIEIDAATKKIMDPMDLTEIFKEDGLADQSKKLDWQIPAEWAKPQLPSGRAPMRGRGE